MYILDVNRANNRAWTPEQAWLLIKSLATNPSIRYNELLLSDTYKSSGTGTSNNNNNTNGESTLQALEQAELITITSTNGRPSSIKPGRPVFAAAFKRLTEDHVLKARMDLAILSQLVQIETHAIEKCESELNLLAQFQLPHRSPLALELQSRLAWLLQKVRVAQDKLERYEGESKGLKEVLRRDF